MINTYEVKLRFHEDTATKGEKEVYREFVGIYDSSSAVGNNQTKTTTVTIHSERELTQKGLERFLGGIIPVLSFKKLE